jgi:hypothetical protein
MTPQQINNLAYNLFGPEARQHRVERASRPKLTPLRRFLRRFSPTFRAEREKLAAALYKHGGIYAIPGVRFAPFSELTGWKRDYWLRAAEAGM